MSASLLAVLDGSGSTTSGISALSAELVLPLAAVVTMLGVGGLVWLASRRSNRNEPAPPRRGAHTPGALRHYRRHDGGHDAPPAGPDAPPADPTQP
jgi:hypothetical protein